MEDQKITLRLKIAELEAVQAEVDRKQTELDDLAARYRSISAEIAEIKESLITGLINE